MIVFEVLTLMATLTAPVGPLARVDDALPAAVGQWQRSGAPEIYDRDSIFSYIDGHGEVYRAYGMRHCLAQRYEQPHGEAGGLVLDVFEMETPEGAFGVFTHDQNGGAVAVGQGGLMRSGWLSFWKGRVFASLYAEDDSEAARKALVTLGERTAAAIEDQAPLPQLVMQLPEGWVPGTRHFFFDSQILRYHLPSLSERVPVELGSAAHAALARYERGGARMELLLVRHESEQLAIENARRVLTGKVGEESPRVVRSRQVGSILAIVLDALGNAQADAFLDEVEARLRRDQALQSE